MVVGGPKGGFRYLPRAPVFELAILIALHRRRWAGFLVRSRSAVGNWPPFEAFSGDLRLASFADRAHLSCSDQD